MTTQSELAALDAAATLLPCPFCGSKPLIGQTLDDAWYAMCEKDHCARLDSYWRTKPEAIGAWNTRANKLVLVPSVESVARSIDPDAWADDLPVPTRGHIIAFHKKRIQSVETARAVLTSMGAKTDGN